MVSAHTNLLNAVNEIVQGLIKAYEQQFPIRSRPLSSLLLLTILMSYYQAIDSFKFPRSTLFNCPFAYQKLDYNRIFSRMDCSRQPLYDAFESDPILVKRLRSETEELRNLTTRSIKTEMERLHVKSADIFDREELIRKLAIARIKISTANEQSLEQRQTDASLLWEEIAKVSTLSDQEVINRLQKYSVNIINTRNRNELDRKLAMLNLGLRPRSSSSSSDASSKAAASSPIDDGNDAIGTAERKFEDLTKRTVASVKEEVGVFSKAITESTQRMKKIILTNVAYTRAELKAKDVIEGKCLDENDYSVDSLKFEEEENQRLLNELTKLKSFDKIQEWALHKPRSTVVKMLKMKSVDIPKYAPLSTLAGFLADAVMSERYTPQHLVDSSSKSDSKVNRNRVESSRRQKQYTREADFSAFAPEKELWRALLSKVQAFVSLTTAPQLWQRLTSLESAENVLRSSVDLLRKSPISVAVFTILNVVSAAGNDLAMRLATWAGGKALAPSHSLFLASLYCILFRRGFISFIGFLISIRFLRAFLQQSDSEYQSPSPSTSPNNVVVV